MEYFHQATSISRECMAAHNGLGYLFITQAMELEYEKSNTEEKKQEELLNKALEKFEFVIEQKENYAEGHNGKGYALLKIAKNLDQKKEALEPFEQAIKLKPEYFEALEHRASILREIENDNVKKHFGISYNVISDDWYQQSDIATVANIILSRNGHSNNQFEIIGNIDSETRKIADNNHLKSFLSSTKTHDLDNNPLFVIYNQLLPAQAGSLANACKAD